jgi:hypothetical protein
MAACGSSNGGSGGGTQSTATLSEACNAVNDTFIDREGECFHASADWVATQKAAAAATCAPLDKEVSAGRVAYDSSKAQACLDAIKALDCSTLAGSDTPAACVAARTGHVANGATCYAGVDCTSGICDLSSTCPGTCVAALAADDDCSTRPDDCGAGLGCQSDNTGAQKCKPLSGVNGPCPCQPGLYCDVNSAAPSCKALKASGAGCVVDVECQAGLACAGTATTTCQAVVGPGAACQPSTSFGGSLCALGYACDPTTQQCVAGPKAGESCVKSAGGSDYTLLCVEGFCDRFFTGATNTCRVPKDDGAACTAAGDCNSGNCDATSHKCTGGGFAVCAAP